MLLETTTTTRRLGRRARSVQLDALRGLAILLMILDHTALHAGLDVLRWTGGRFAMPLFMLIAGSLVRRLSWRMGGVLVLGVMLPVAFDWLTAPGILVAYVIGAVAILIVQTVAAGSSRELLVGYAVVGTVAVALAANGVQSWLTGAVALMVIGAAVGAARIEVLGGSVPRWLAGIGRYPLRWYVCHIIALDALVFAGWFG